MLDNIIRFSIKNKLIVGILTLGLIIWGGWSLNKLPMDAVPDITNNQVQIITITPTLAAQETEQLVTFPIEQSIATIPDIEEIRSISRFGLSVVTVVFEENVDIYFARQLINERIREAEEQIPEGVGKPELAPVSTGLGEVYQYVIHPAKGSEDKYSAMDLRTMQDWIVARQLYGISGVAEVNSFGGKLKQYEVVIQPDRLKAMNVSVSEIFEALEKNNENTGGAYIDKKPNAYFIRSIGLINTFSDIEQIMIKKVNNVPVLIRDVAAVQWGAAIPYGAMTYNGEKEVVGGIVMMLKGYNSSEVVQAVKKRMESIQKSLPPDVVIEPFLDRTDLVGRAISTVKTNLLEGALIVIFVLVLFLGNFRAGLIVASAIPLAMLFAIGMMHLLGISANLMSLGAIDFGLIVDGAVIIVEAVMHHLALRKTPGRLTQAEMDTEVFVASSKIRKSASFGEVIILIVYIPILALVGVEGKMFKPMAQTVCFAIMGALILSLTYIPMMAALFLSKTVSRKQTFSDRMMVSLQRVYTPLLRKAIRIKYIIVAITVGLFGLAAFFFSRMGGEFIPQLQEGDYAFHCILPQGTSLSQSIETSMLASRIIKSFPEVKMVVGKTGTAEVPADPMPPEATDMIIVLKPKKEWTTTDDYMGLADSIMERLSVIPGVFFEVSQPIQMRFNELMTGVRQDVAIKIFGENIDKLAELAQTVSNEIKNIEGVAPPQVEATVGLPQITVEYNRNILASYGLNVQDVNKVIRTAFAGGVAGVVFENERRFNLVVKLDTLNRTSIEDVRNLYIPIGNGNQVPLYQVADIDFKEGPAQISREDGKRRIVIGFNVHNRDVASVVKDVQNKLDKNVKLPVGYYFTYGGTFENLQQATERLNIAVPIALLLILFLLFLTFHSLKDSLLIFTAIPMSAIGGVLALMLRGMPFSISAGIGFIALFGVAVLNGIVLLGTFRQLEADGITDVMQRVYEGTRTRLRPVLMTATVASLGFLPMAISTGAGAEVQKPLATVVIGGLITATLLTLIVLPILYIIFNTKTKIKMNHTNVVALIGLLVLGLCTSNSFAQEERIALEDALLLVEHNMEYQINRTEQLKNRQEAKAVAWTSKTGVFVENEDLRPNDPVGIWKVGLSQTIPWPGIYSAEKRWYGSQANIINSQQKVLVATLKQDVSLAYYRLWYLQEKYGLYQQLDSLYKTLDHTAKLKVQTGDRPGLDSIVSNVRWKEIEAYRYRVAKEMEQAQATLAQLLNTDKQYLPPDKPLPKLAYGVVVENVSHPLQLVQEYHLDAANKKLSMERQGQMPEFSGRFFSQRYLGMSNPFTGFSVSMSFPIFNQGAYRNKIKAAKTNILLEEQQLLLTHQKVNMLQTNALLSVEKNSRLLRFYETEGLRQSKEIISAATLSYNAGEISYAELSQYLTQAIAVEQNYLEQLNNYNQSVVKYQFYTNK